MDVATLRGRLKTHHQEHLLKYWDDPQTTSENQKQLFEDLMDINFAEMNAAFEKSTGIKIGHTENGESMTNGLSVNDASNEQGHEHFDTKTKIPINEKMQPVENELCASIRNCSDDELEEFRSVTLDHIANGHIGVLLLAGGQGTRLGVPYPKGKFFKFLKRHHNH